MQSDQQSLRAELTRVQGGEDERWSAMVATDPQVVAEYVRLADATDRRKALSPVERELIHIAVASSTAHVFEPGMRLHIANALRLGASQGEILDVLRLTSVLGVHSLIPAIEIVIAEMGGPEVVKQRAAPEQHQRLEQIKQLFMKTRGTWGDVWEKCALLSPDFTEAYAGYSGLPHQAANLPEKFRELVYIAIDISPAHFNATGARVHVQKALQAGATLDELMETIEIASLIGFHTCVAALPILAQELAGRL
jgi:alkylhydroperoxidase/carboxymuconolactone decarboxylase family protein YurZ